MNYESLSDTLDKKILDFNLKILGLIASILIKPLALATEPFFRKDFGERYLTCTSASISLLLWLFASKITSWFFGDLLEKEYQKAGFYKTANWLHEHNLSLWVAGFVVGTYSGLALINLARARSRRKTGKVWYSMSRGGSIFGSENKVRDIIIAIVVVVVLLAFAPPIAFLFFISRFASYYLAAKQQNNFYSRYLDAMDAKIESEFLQRALEKGEPPSNTDGLHCPLPKTIKGEYRTRVARVVAGGPFVAGATAATQGTPQPHQQFATTPQNDPNTISMIISQAAELKPVFQAGWKMARQTPSFIKSVASSKRFIRLVVATLVVVACLVAGFTVFRFVKSHRKPPVVASKVVTERAQPPAANPAPTTPAITEHQNQPPQTTPTIVPAKENLVTPTQNVSETQGSPTQEQIIKQIENTLVAEDTKISKFKDDCDDARVGELLEIQGVASSYKTSFNQQSGKIQKKEEAVVNSQRAYLRKFQQDLQANVTNPQFDPQGDLEKLERAIPKMEHDRQHVSQALDALETAIKNAAPAH